ncbi:hypothetical protein BJF78_04165 [Pseudonocardia sp. CNS-139]|nr:hypothetical protein BJF78_04165 [Pseudonocardia sp. CNS-139]
MNACDVWLLRWSANCAAGIWSMVISNPASRAAVWIWVAAATVSGSAALTARLNDTPSGKPASASICRARAGS